MSLRHIQPEEVPHYFVTSVVNVYPSWTKSQSLLIIQTVIPMIGGQWIIVFQCWLLPEDRWVIVKCWVPVWVSACYLMNILQQLFICSEVISSYNQLKMTSLLVHSTSITCWDQMVYFGVWLDSNARELTFCMLLSLFVVTKSVLSPMANTVHSSSC